MKTIGRGLALWAFALALVVTTGVAVDESAAQLIKKKSIEEKATEKFGGELRFEVYTDKGGKYRWRLFTGDGHEIAMSVHGYAQEAEARQAIEAIRRGAAHARIGAEEEGTKKERESSTRKK